jgi:hypothetical protein
MMNRTLHVAIILTVAAHTVLGCCYHHAHAAVSVEDLSISVEFPGCACEHDGHEHGGETGAPDGEERECNEGSCIFTLPDSPQVRDVLARLQDCAPVFCLPVVREASWSTTVDRAVSWLTATTRLHLLNQVLLI